MSEVSWRKGKPPATGGAGARGSDAAGAAVSPSTRRLTMYRAALQAAQEAGGAPTEEMRAAIYTLVSLAAEAPSIDIIWVQDGTAVAGTLGRGSARAVALVGQAAIATPAIVSVSDLATAHHEVGHHRRWNHTHRRLEQELVA